MHTAMTQSLLLTWYSVTNHSCIFTMNTVVDSNAEMGAVSQACLSPSAGYVVIVDRTAACTKVGFSTCRCGSAVVELLADHIGISDVPTVITHSAPCSIVVDLYTSFTVRSTSHQSDCSICHMTTTPVGVLALNLITCTLRACHKVELTCDEEFCIATN